MTAHINPSSSCYEVTIHKVTSLLLLFSDLIPFQVLAHTELPSETTFGCEIYIPGTEYFVRYSSTNMCQVTIMSLLK